MKPDIIHIAALEAKDARIKELEEAIRRIWISQEMSRTRLEIKKIVDEALGKDHS